MKQSTLIRETAYPAAPQLSSGFVPPVDFDLKISVDLRGHDIRVYGFDGSQWNVIHDADGTISDFIADVTHQKYYLESKTGSNQEVRIIFLSSLAQSNLHSFNFGSTAGSRKLHHFGDVPVYHGDVAGKFLTVRSDGSLAWLGADESFTVAPEGGQQGGGAIFLEELATAVTNLHASANITNGIFTQTSDAPGQKGSTKVDLDIEGIMNYSGNSLDPKEWTLSFWVAAEADIGSGHNYCGGRFEPNKELRLAMAKTGDGFMQFKPIIGNLWTGTPTATSTTPFAVGEFHHCAVTYGLSSGQTDEYDLKIFIDGVKGGESLQKSFHVLDKNADGALFGLGKATYGASFNGNGGMFSLDSVQLAHDALTEVQVAAIAAQSDRQMSIDAASQISAPAVPQANFLEDLARFNFPNGIYTDTGHGGSHRVNFNLDGDNIISYGADGQHVEEEFTISWWMNLNTSQAGGTVSVLGNYALPNRFALKVGGNLTSNAHITTQIGNQIMFNNNSGIAIAGDWVHGTYTCKSNGSNLIVSLYINGTKLPGTKSYALGTKLLPSTSNDVFAFGGSGMSGKSVKGQFDSMQIEDGIALTDAQVAAIAAQTDRQMGIGAASQL